MSEQEAYQKKMKNSRGLPAGTATGLQDATCWQADPGAQSLACLVRRGQAGEATFRINLTVGVSRPPQGYLAG